MIKFALCALALTGAAAAVAGSTSYTSVGGTLLKSTDGGADYQSIGTTSKGPQAHRKVRAHAAAKASDAQATDDSAAAPDMSGTQRIGDTKYSADGVTCQKVGDSTVCN